MGFEKTASTRADLRRLPGTISLHLGLKAAAACLVITTLLLVVACGEGRHSDTAQGGTNPGGKTVPPDNASHPSDARKIDWVRFGFDPARGGVNPEETLISPKTVGGLRLLWRTRLPDVVDSSPILVHDLRLAHETRDVLYATTKGGTTVALDAASGEILWSHGTSGPQITTSSPVADPSRGSVYSYGLDGAVHEYAATTGQEQNTNGWPARITRMPRTEKGSSALNIAGGRIYVTTSGYVGDTPPYQGHAVTIDESTGAEEVFNSLCSDTKHLLSAGECPSERSGIWARGGAVVDPATRSVFATTGNGPYDANTGGNDYGDSVLKLGSEDLWLLDSYTPETFRRLEEEDADLGSTAPALLPEIPRSKTPLLLVQGGKDGMLRLVDRENLSGAGEPGHVGGQVQAIRSAGCATFTQPVVWTDGGGRVWVIAAGTCGIAAYRVSTDAAGTTGLRLAWKTDDETTTPVLAGGVLFGATDGAVITLDPRTGQRLWSSDQESAGGSIGGIHWESPIVVNGRLYVSDESGVMTAYGLTDDRSQ
jgi:outer membrane protein assembly factor BamB